MTKGKNTMKLQMGGDIETSRAGYHSQYSNNKKKSNESDDESDDESQPKKGFFDLFTKAKGSKKSPITENIRDYGRPDQVKEMEQVFWKEIEDAAIININKDNNVQQPKQSKKEKCIVTIGDPSNFSGFLALILYYKVALDNGYDVVYVMNYPTFLLPNKTQGLEESIQDITNAKEKYNVAASREAKFSNFDDMNGRGHRQNGNLPITSVQTDELNKQLKIRAEKEQNDAIKKVNEMMKKEKMQQPKEAQDKRGYQYSYEQFKRIRRDMENLQGLYEPEYKSSLENITMYLISTIWDTCQKKYSPQKEKIPQLYYLCSKGIYNSINPFKPENVIIEINQYDQLIRPIGGKINEQNENIFLDTLIPTYFDDYNTILMDMNGSMAWFSIFTDEEKKKFCDKVEKCFVMGGFLENSMIQYKPFNNLNVSEQASINQLYHPENVAKFFEIIDKNKMIFITNHECHTNFSFDPKTYVLLKDAMNLPKLKNEGKMQPYVNLVGNLIGRTIKEMDSNYRNDLTKITGKKFIQGMQKDSTEYINSNLDKYNTGIERTFQIGLKNSNQFHIIPAFYLSDYIINNKLFDKGTINTVKLYFNDKIGAVMLSSDAKELSGFKTYGDVQIVSISRCTSGTVTDHTNGREKYLSAIKSLLLPNNIQAGGNALQNTIIYTPKPNHRDHIIIGHEIINGKKMEISKINGSEKYYINIKKLDSKYKKQLMSLKKRRNLNSKTRKN
jgi:hypothetical protein